MTAKETERLTRVEQKQEDMVESIRQLSKTLEEQSRKLDELNSKFDNLTGGKQALMWVTGISLTIFGLVIGFLNLNKHN